CLLPHVDYRFQPLYYVIHCYTPFFGLILPYRGGLCVHAFVVGWKTIRDFASHGSISFNDKKKQKTLIF
ncbi:MAG: hypothetical protein FWC78_07855, partial [Defluviitaleaceae bacterium]|nr:hypothetical protein [Defluviitaleaceae bacterium]